MQADTDCPNIIIGSFGQMSIPRDSPIPINILSHSKTQ